MHNRRASGFTLIELLIVIAIIAILAAILFPVFAKVREKARESACASNMKQISLALLQYVQDNNETYPSTGNYSPTGFLGWSLLVAPYLKSNAVYTCPSNPNTTYYYNTQQINDYGGNQTYNLKPGTLPYGGIFAPQQGIGLELSQVRAPSQTIAFGEMSKYNSWNFQLQIDVAAPAGPTYPPLFAGHQGFSNYAFADGHVKALTPFATISTNDGGSGAVNMWTIDNKDFSVGKPSVLPVVKSNLTITTTFYK